MNNPKTKNVIVIGQYLGKPAVFVVDVEDPSIVTPENFGELMITNESSIFICNSQEDTDIVAEAISLNIHDVHKVGAIEKVKDENFKVFKFTKYECKIEEVVQVDYPIAHQGKVDPEVETLWDRLRDYQKDLIGNLAIPSAALPRQHIPNVLAMENKPIHVCYEGTQLDIKNMMSRIVGVKLSSPSSETDNE